MATLALFENRGLAAIEVTHSRRSHIPIRTLALAADLFKSAYIV